MTTPKIYVGTYRRYNEGSLHGAWIDLEECGDAETFWAKVNELHADELQRYGEIEPMFQDWEGIPSRFISESNLNADVWEQWVELDEDDRQMLERYLSEVNGEGTLDEAREAFIGKFDSEMDFAVGHWEDTGLLASIPENLRHYIDYEAWLRDAKIEWLDITYHEGDFWAFRKDC